MMDDAHDWDDDARTGEVSLFSPISWRSYMFIDTINLCVYGCLSTCGVPLIRFFPQAKISPVFAGFPLFFPLSRHWSPR